MTSGTSALTFCRAEEKDFEQLVSLVAKVLQQGHSLHADEYDMDKWKWKYWLMPHAEPLIFICKEEDQIMGYYHCPVYRGTINGIEKKFAMVQDVGVSEAARGKGVFRKLAEYATNRLLKSDVNFIYTFPNDNSIHTFYKYNGYSKIETLSTYILPVNFSNIIASKFKFLKIERLAGALLGGLYSVKLQPIKNKYIIKPEEKLTQAMADVFIEFNRSFSNALTRDYNYLHWRFELKPNCKHFFFTASDDKQLLAVAVFSIDDLPGNKAAVLIDFAIRENNYDAFSQLMIHVKKYHQQYFNQPVTMLFTSVAGNHPQLFSKAGFIKIPEKFNPRALHLLGKNVTEDEQQVLNPRNWNFTLSEWDVL